MSKMKRFFVALALAGLAAMVTTEASLAAQGDCGQPVSAGTKPVATDCLFILNASVGLQTCSPACICNVNDSPGNPNATDALICLNVAVNTPGVTLNCG